MHVGQLVRGSRTSEHRIQRRLPHVLLHPVKEVACFATRGTAIELRTHLGQPSRHVSLAILHNTNCITRSTAGYLGRAGHGQGLVQHSFMSMVIANPPGWLCTRRSNARSSSSQAARSRGRRTPPNRSLRVAHQHNNDSGAQQDTDAKGSMAMLLPSACSGGTCGSHGTDHNATLNTS